MFDAALGHLADLDGIRKTAGRDVDGKPLVSPEEQAVHERKQAAARWAAAGRPGHQRTRPAATATASGMSQGDAASDRNAGAPAVRTG